MGSRLRLSGRILGISFALVAVILALSVYTIPREQAPEHKSHAMEQTRYFGDLDS